MVKTWIVRGVAALALIIVLVAAAAYMWLRTSLPQTEGEIAVSGLDAKVTIIRDGVGVPTIVAESERDAYFALGFVHAQDRLSQMDLMRRLGSGRLAEVVGPIALGSDRLMRTLGLRRLAEQNLEHLSPQVRDSLEAYSAGVNAYLATRTGALPLPFVVLRYTPEPWTPVDSLIWGKVMLVRLAGNWRDELMRARLAAFLRPEQIAQLWPNYPEDGPVTLAPDTKAAQWSEPVPELAGRILAALPPPFRERRSASNSWAVSGALTGTGKPVLANDPHLGLTVPGVWYLVRIETPTLTVAGASTPGVPFVILGHNTRIAWGFTTTNSDTQDLFIEKLDPADPGRYLTPSGSEPFVVRDETIAVRGGNPVTLRVRETRHGPVVSDVAPELGGSDDERFVFALADTGLRPDDRTAEAIYHLNHSRTWTEFEAALENFHSPQQNIVYADVDGNIGFIAPARVPIRKSGIGVAPVEGWTGAHDWIGTIPYDRLPRAFNPRNGQIVAANNRIVPDDYPYFLSRDWDPPFRAKRITDLLAAARGEANVAYSVSMQRDALSLAARGLAPLLLERLPEPDAEAGLAERLRAWDGRMDRNRPEPLIFTAWVRALMARIFADELRDQFERYWGPKFLVLANVLLLHPEWCDNVTTPLYEPCEEMVTLALRDAREELEARLGKNVDDWSWGGLHRVQFEQQVFSRLSVLGWLERNAIGTDGADDTINRGSTPFADPDNPYAHIHGSTLRAVYDLTQLDDSFFMTVPGQSENPLSPHDADLLEPWRDGAYIRLVPPPEGAGRRLILSPLPQGEGRTAP